MGWGVRMGGAGTAMEAPGYDSVDRLRSGGRITNRRAGDDSAGVQIRGAGYDLVGLKDRGCGSTGFVALDHRKKTPIGAHELMRGWILGRVKDGIWTLGWGEHGACEVFSKQKLREGDGTMNLYPFFFISSTFFSIPFPIRTSIIPQNTN
jgi:hypothetical protein